MLPCCQVGVLYVAALSRRCVLYVAVLSSSCTVCCCVVK